MIVWSLIALTGGGGGQGFSAFGGAIDGGRIWTSRMLTGVVCHREKEGRMKEQLKGRYTSFGGSKEKT
jgi:hypothetical protein